MPKRRPKLALANQSTQDPLTGKRKQAGWDMLLSDQDLEKRRYTSEQLSQLKRRKEAILNAVAMGMPIKDIAGAYCVHYYSVIALIRAHPEAVTAGREKQGHRLHAYAGIIADSYMRDLASGKVKPATKPIALGIFIDKGLTLGGHATSIIEHRRTAGASVPEVNDFWTVEAEVVESGDGQSAAPGAEPKQIGPPSAADTAFDTAPTPVVEPAPALEPGPEAQAPAPPARDPAQAETPRGGVEGRRPPDPSMGSGA